MTENQPQDDISKTRKKREAEIAQQLGIRICALPKEIYDSMPLSETLRKAMNDYRTIKSHGAKRRQAQYIGKIMRSLDYPALQCELDERERAMRGQSEEFHLAEQWRERLLESPEALTEFIQQYHPRDIQQLRQIIQKAMQDRQKERNTGGAKALFRFIREVIE
jgi:ribosome-associated protein